jgi:quercetin dioxygenase-like cupin family protein
VTVVDELVPAIADSALALDVVRLEPSETVRCGDGECDCLLYVHEGVGTLALGAEMHSVGRGSAALVLAGEEAAVTAGSSELALVRATAGPETDRHAPLGPRETVVGVEEATDDRATGSRSFRILFGPHNGSTRATLFVGYVPPGKAPWHYHLYDEIVWIIDGPGRLHAGNRVDELADGSAFRLRPRQVHIVENESPDRELELLGFFTPAGSPSAAYLAAGAVNAYT